MARLGWSSQGGGGGLVGATGPAGPAGAAGATGATGPAGTGFVDAGTFTWSVGNSATKVAITNASTATRIVCSQVSGSVTGGILRAYPGRDTNLSTLAPGYVTFTCTQALFDGLVSWVRIVE